MPNETVKSIGDYIRTQREQAGKSMRQLAQAAGVSNPYLSQIERGLRKPSADILQQIAKGLRISAEALYVQAGILEDRPADSGVRSALLADPDLSERQKQSLIEIYESFRREAAAAAAHADPAALPAGEFGLFEDEPTPDEAAADETVVDEAVADGLRAAAPGVDGGAPGDEALLVEAALAGAPDAEDANGPDAEDTERAGRMNGRKRSNVWAEAAAEQEPHDSTSD
jgi:transcriptional regulator with XRE-family HTH domain